MSGLEFPESLRVLAREEERTIDEQAVIKRLTRAGVTNIVPYEPTAFGGLVLFFDEFPISIDNIWSDSASPLADAFDEAVAVAERWDLLRTLHSALMDMDQVAHAARELVAAKEQAWPNVETTTEEIRKLTVLGEVLETGMVTMYARHFTGDRRLPGRWWPRGKRRLVHDRLIERRNTVVAHADETTERKLVTLPTEGDGPPVTVIAEARQQMTEDDLHELVHHCERMYARYSDAVLQLKWDMGIGASGQILGPNEYDEYETPE